MQKLAKVIFLLIALNAPFVFGSRVDQGSTSEGTAFQAGTGLTPPNGLQCTSSEQTAGAPCLQYFPNGAQFGLVGTVGSENPLETTFSAVTAIYVFNAALPVLFTPSSFTNLDDAHYGVSNCGADTSFNSNINIKSADSAVHVPCVNLIATGDLTDSEIVETPDGLGNSTLLYTGPTSALQNGENIVFYVKIDAANGAEGSFSQTQTPEPGSALLFASGLGTLMAYRRRRSLG